jgi:hypothetical protein
MKRTSGHEPPAHQVPAYVTSIGKDQRTDMTPSSLLAASRFLRVDRPACALMKYGVHAYLFTDRWSDSQPGILTRP